MLKSAVIAFVLSFGLSVHATTTSSLISEVTSQDPNYDFYTQVANVEQTGAQIPGVDSTLTYAFRAIKGHIVALNDGTILNPINVVLTVNEKLYFLPTHLSNFTNWATFRRVWKKDAGIYLVVRGFRMNRDTDLLDRVEATIKVATTDGLALSVLKYSEVAVQAQR